VHGVADSEWQRKMAWGGDRLRKKYREQWVARRARKRVLRSGPGRKNDGKDNG
jgi:hypothetical protein